MASFETMRYTSVTCLDISCIHQPNMSLTDACYMALRLAAITQRLKAFGYLYWGHCMQKPGTQDLRGSNVQQMVHEKREAWSPGELVHHNMFTDIVDIPAELDN